VYIRVSTFILLQGAAHKCKHTLVKKYGNLEGRIYIYMMNDFLKTFLLRYRKSFLKTVVAPEPHDQIYFILFFYQCARLT
jgi:hypothetical protein